MDTLKSVLDKSFNIDFVSAVLSNPREKDGTVKVKIRPVMKQDRLLFQSGVSSESGGGSDFGICGKPDESFQADADGNKAVPLPGSC